ncbi:MAG: AAA family ATPase, partial [bacterium]|nr:AAA family ATPase [bacterium]
MDKIDILEQLVKENPGNASSWYLLGLEYLEINGHSKAFHAFSKALEFCDDELREKIFAQIAKLSNAGDTRPDHHKTEENGAAETAKDSENGTAEYPEKDIEVPGAKNGSKKDEIEEIEEKEQPRKLTMSVIDGGSPGVSREPEGPDEPHHLATITFDDVGGLHKLKKKITMKIIKPFSNPGLFKKFKKKIGGGIFLYGPPGCGKTFVSRATAGECQARFIPVHITDILDPYIGVSERNIHDIFENARNNTPAVLFFDEIDALGYSRSKASSSHLRPLVDQLLTEMEGIDSSTHKLLIIGASNMPWDLDPAFKRPGRFDNAIFVPPPDETAREVIFKLKIEGKPLEAIDYQKLAHLTPLFSGADIQNVVEVAAEKVIEEIMESGVERPIRMTDLLAAVA